MAKASDNVYPKVIVAEGTAPSSPSAGQQKLYIDSADHKLKRKDSAGTVTIIEAGSAGSVATDAIFDAKGDLPVGTGADTAAKLTAGANGLALVTDSSQSTGLKWGRPKASAVRVTNSTSQALTSGAFLTTAWDTETFDTDGYHSTSSNTSRLVVPTGFAGMYVARGLCYFSIVSGATGGERVVQIIKNGVSTASGILGRNEGVASSGSHAETADTGPIILADGDYLEMQAYNESGGSWQVDTSISWFSMMRVGD